jgi:hypothetical protein
MDPRRAARCAANQYAANVKRGQQRGQAVRREPDALRIPAPALRMLARGYSSKQP